jgi:hypothetical protein
MPDDDIPVHTIQSVVTPDSFELGVHRMRFNKRWLYWFQPVNGCIVWEWVDDADVADAP